jgi:hypothetical protein
MVGMHVRPIVHIKSPSQLRADQARDRDLSLHQERATGRLGIVAIARARCPGPEWDNKSSAFEN